METRISTGLFGEPGFGSLDLESRLLWLFLHTNEKANTTGAYQISIGEITHRTGIPMRRARIILEEFQEDGAIRYEADGTIRLQDMGATTGKIEGYPHIRLPEPQGRRTRR